jgi:hypothetical protein
VSWLGFKIRIEYLVVAVTCKTMAGVFVRPALGSNDESNRPALSDFGSERTADGKSLVAAPATVPTITPKMTVVIIAAWCLISSLDVIFHKTLKAA